MHLQQLCFYVCYLNIDEQYDNPMIKTMSKLFRLIAESGRLLLDSDSSEKNIVLLRDVII